MSLNLYYIVHPKGKLYAGIIWLQAPESFTISFSHANMALSS